MPPSFQVIFKNRDFTVRDPLQVNIQVVEYSFAAKGGPYRATLQATGDEFALWTLFNDLRCPVEIYDDLGVRVWWGLVYEIELTTGKIQFKSSLANVFNRVSVGYSYIATGTQEVGQRKTTTAVNDVNSQAEYGIKELLQLSGGLSDDEANALSAGLLAKNAWPKGGLTSSSLTSGGAGVTIYLRGWWDTAFWQYASKSTTASTETSVQIKDLLATFAPLLSGVEMDATAISSSDYQDGSKLVGEVVEEMCAASISTGLDCLINVDANRLAYISREPASSTINYTVNTEGLLLTTAGEKVRDTTPPVGVYVKTSDIIPAVVNQTIIKDAGVQFIVESGWRREEPYYIFRDAYADMGSTMSWGADLQNAVLPLVADWAFSGWTAWTPTITGMTETGSPVYSGYYWLIGQKLLIITVTLAHNGGTYASTSGTTYINNLPFTVVVGGGVIVRANAPDTAGVVYVGGTTVYLPTWAAASHTKIITAVVRIA